MIDENLYENATASIFKKDRINRIKVRILSSNIKIFRNKIDE